MFFAVHEAWSRRKARLTIRPLMAEKHGALHRANVHGSIKELGVHSQRINPCRRSLLVHQIEHLEREIVIALDRSSQSIHHINFRLSGKQFHIACHLRTTKHLRHRICIESFLGPCARRHGRRDARRKQRCESRHRYQLQQAREPSSSNSTSHAIIPFLDSMSTPLCR